MDHSGLRKVPNLLRKCRKVRQLRQKDVAKILGLKSPSRISRWEKGLCMPSAMNLLRLSVVYRVMVDAVFPDLLRSLRQELKKREEELLGQRSTSSRHD